MGQLVPHAVAQTHAEQVEVLYVQHRLQGSGRHSSQRVGPQSQDPQLRAVAQKHAGRVPQRVHRQVQKLQVRQPPAELPAHFADGVVPGGKPEELRHAGSQPGGQAGDAVVVHVQDLQLGQRPLHAVDAGVVEVGDAVVGHVERAEVVRAAQRGQEGDAAPDDLQHAELGQVGGELRVHVAQQVGAVDEHDLQEVEAAEGVLGDVVELAVDEDELLQEGQLRDHVAVQVTAGRRGAPAHTGRKCLARLPGQPDLRYKNKT